MYDYRCDACGHRFEVRQSFSDEPLSLCPQCTGRVRRVVHPAGVIFKGSGWYITDSRKASSASQSSESISTSKSDAPSTSSKNEDIAAKAAADD
jgi:putative FmdB family regulatory protein